MAEAEGRGAAYAGERLVAPDGRERYEDALMEGKSAALVEQDRADLFRQEIGNVHDIADDTSMDTVR